MPPEQNTIGAIVLTFASALTLATCPAFAHGAECIWRHLPHCQRDRWIGETEKLKYWYFNQIPFSIAERRRAAARCGVNGKPDHTVKSALENYAIRIWSEHWIVSHDNVPVRQLDEAWKRIGADDRLTLSTMPKRPADETASEAALQVLTVRFARQLRANLDFGGDEDQADWWRCYLVSRVNLEQAEKHL